MSQPPFGRRTPANMPAMATAAAPRRYAPAPEIAPRPGAHWLATGVDLFFNPNGRLSRGQYRSARYPMLVLFGALGRLLSLTHATATPAVHIPDLWQSLAFLVTILLVSALFVWCGVILTIKRWHDLDKSAWWALLGCVPVVGWIWQLVRCNFTPGTPGTNTYGPPTTWK